MIRDLLKIAEFPEVIDSTMVSAWKGCPQKFLKEYIFGLSPAGESIHLRAGHAFAAGLEATRLAFYGDKASEEDSLAAGFVALTRDYGDQDPDDPTHNKRWDRMVEALQQYFTKWPLATDLLQPALKSDGKPAVEFSFAIPLPFKHPVTGDPLLYAGRFDMLATYGDNKTLFIEDDKTTSQLGATWGKQWDMRSQFTGYCWAMHQVGYPVAGVFVRGIALLKTQINFGEAVTYRPEWRLNRWYEQLLGTVQQMLKSYDQLQNDPGSPHLYFPYDEADSCTSYGGCLFQSLCGTQREEVWLGDYAISRWRPERGVREVIYENALDALE